MDMDMPEPNELEWLEANSRFYEDQLDLPPPEEEDLRWPHQSPPPSTGSPIKGHKRARSDGLDSPNDEDTTLSEEKKCKIDDVVPQIDEDWLRYSPPHEINGGNTEEETVVVVAEEERIVSRYASLIDGEFIPVTEPSGGDRIYVKMCRVDREERCKKLDLKAQSNDLISEPINVLFQRLEQEALTKALQASSEHQSDRILPETKAIHEQLWVDKYAPNSFTELLSDEQTNREVLLWFKQWDSHVFGSEIRSTTDEVLSALRRHSSAAQHQKPSDLNFLRKNRGHRWVNANIRNSNNLDYQTNNQKGIQEIWNKKSRVSGPPEHKVLLLCGPPGLGKTTLAHIAAKHCGYRVVEVNASDDRSSSTIEAKILDVIQMNSVTADSRPKCLVIDEIDGALGEGKGAVEVILKMASAERNSEVGKENMAKGEKLGKISSKKGRKTSSLSRPVICICNDLYAPALRPLLQVAKVHIFVQPTVSRVVSRLKYICNKEGLKTNSIALSALAEYTECDIRSCLNTLQFLNNRKETLNVFDIGSQVAGRKDVLRSFFDIWKEIFQKRKTKERKSNNSCSSRSDEFDFLHSLISSRGDYDVMLDGIHENILQLHYHDPLMQKTIKCFDGLCTSDLTHQYIIRMQQMSLHAYMPSLAIKVHWLVAQPQKPNIEWPKSYQRCRTTMMEKMNILRSWKNKILPYISRHLSTKSFIEDYISPMLHILSPTTLRPVALHLMTEKEKCDLAQLVGTMVSYSIIYKSFKSDRPSSNQEYEATFDASALSFDPPIWEFINFRGYSSGHHVLPLAMKQVLVHEVEKQKILQVSRHVQSTDGCNNENLNLVERREAGTMFAKKTDGATASASKKNNINNALNSRQCNPNCAKISSTMEASRTTTSIFKPKSMENAKKPSRSSTSFFDRFMKASSKSSQDMEDVAQKTTSEKDSHPLLFKFNEGFTNAVKQPVRMREFLLSSVAVLESNSM